MSSDGALKTVVIGSFRKHLVELSALKQGLQENGINVLSPVGDAAKNPGEEFVILNQDPLDDHRTLQDSIFAKMRSSTFIVVGNVDGYLGNTALLEIGYAVSLGIQVLTLEPIEDPNIKPYTRLLSDLFPSIQIPKVLERCGT